MFTVQALISPIRFNADGVALVGPSRVPLAAVIDAFRDGDSPEQIVDSYPALALADVYAVIAHYLQQPDEIDHYLAQEDAQAEAARADMEEAHPELFTLQARLRRRKAEGKPT